MITVGHCSLSKVYFLLQHFEGGGENGRFSSCGWFLVY
jgi:hypothetical protein